ncbi:maleylpyruvate isomerase N-terminal domain-containing protein [Belliella marina]|uniref:Maleylpyruvate isomerase N-terminal domain-containing protein n=1 Tax=Belliella marina TaxID=1644146 RepID=A0ABW4VNH7_9BACT
MPDASKRIDTLALFPILDRMLIELLSSLTEEEWEVQTVAKLWKVKDVASHLLDGNLRALSISRDGFVGEKPENINSYQDLVSYLNGLNLAWTNATKRLSTRVLVNLLESSGKEYYEHLQTLNPSDQAVFSVAWAGEDVSPNWFHIAREYTEKFLHQQQIRDAVNKPGLMTKELFYPFIDTLMYAFPYTFQNISAKSGTVVSMVIPSEIGGMWNIVNTENGWELNKDRQPNPSAQIIIKPEIAWKLFSKSWKPEQVISEVEIKGDGFLAKHALSMVAVMA